MSAPEKYIEILDDLRKEIHTHAVSAKAEAAITELLKERRKDREEIERLSRKIAALELKEDEKQQDLGEGNRSPYRIKR